MKVELRPHGAKQICVCDYCGQSIDRSERVVVEAEGPELVRLNHFDLHRNCVVAFATRILNEFEKL
jgi:hypothetical protein